MKRYQTSLFIFRRDFRLNDNSALNAALTQSHQVIASFIFDPQQIDPHPYQSQFGLQFMLQALANLSQQLASCHGRLYFFQENPVILLSQLTTLIKLDAIFVNRDYTPFSRHRDEALSCYCQQHSIDFNVYSDVLLNEPEAILKSNNKPYQVFTPFHKYCSLLPVKEPQILATGQWVKQEIPLNKPYLLLELKKSSTISLNFSMLDDLSSCKNYSQQHDFPAKNVTSHLAPYLKFGCYSIRQVYFAVANQLGIDHPLLRQFYWRDFFYHIAFHFPQVFGHAFNHRYANIPWRRDEELFWRWAQGTTGFPIVDAGMRQLNETGCLPNRVRMIVASFLVKDLHISWRWGERYFAQRLIDYDPCINNGNWQWAASTGCDAQPYFRIFNPWLQQKKFDPDGDYIKQWVPELRLLSAKKLHELHLSTIKGYPAPIIDHKQQTDRIKTLFKQAAGEKVTSEQEVW